MGQNGTHMDVHVLPQRRLGPFQVGMIGLGCMNLSHAYGMPPSFGDSERVVRRAVDLGITLFDTAALYGFGANEELVGEILAPVRKRIVLASKCGIDGVRMVDGFKRTIDGRPATLKATCADSLRRLRTDVIDLLYLHRWDKSIPIEESVGALADLVREGKVRAIGLSEVSAANLRRAHAIHPIGAVQSEYSLWTRNPEIALLKTCRELGIAFVAFSPLARGYLTGALRDIAALDAKDIRRAMPRFAPGNYETNLELLEIAADIAGQAGCSLPQLALAWVLSRGEFIIPIPGTTRVEHLEENVAACGVRLSAAQLQDLDSVFHPRAIAGARYNAANQAEIDTEQF